MLTFQQPAMAHHYQPPSGAPPTIKTYPVNTMYLYPNRSPSSSPTSPDRRSFETMNSSTSTESKPKRRSWLARLSSRSLRSSSPTPPAPEPELFILTIRCTVCAQHKQSCPFQNDYNVNGGRQAFITHDNQPPAKPKSIFESRYPSSVNRKELELDLCGWTSMARNARELVQNRMGDTWMSEEEGKELAQVNFGRFRDDLNANRIRWELNEAREV